MRSPKPAFSWKTVLLLSAISILAILAAVLIWLIVAVFLPTRERIQNFDRVLEMEKEILRKHGLERLPQFPD